MSQSHSIKGGSTDEAFQVRCFLRERGASDGAGFDRFNLQDLQELKKHWSRGQKRKKTCNRSVLTLLVTVAIKFLHTRLTETKQNPALCQSHHMAETAQVTDWVFRMLFVLFTWMKQTVQSERGGRTFTVNTFNLFSFSINQNWILLDLKQLW